MKKLKDINILIIDDMQTSFEVLSSIIKKFFPEINIDYLSSGENIIDFLSNNKVKYNLIFIDVMMPDKDGIIILNEIKTYNKKIPLIAHTSINAPETLLDIGFSDFYLKGSSINDLLAIFKLHLKISPK